MLNKKERRLRRARQLRVRVSQQSVVRLSVNRTGCNVYASLISSDGSRILACASTLGSEFRNYQIGGDALIKTWSVEAARLVGRSIAEKARAVGVDKVAFDRSGFAYHGRVKALADAAREAGLQF